MITITHEELKRICASIKPNTDVFVPYLNQYMQKYDITRPLRVAAFLAQLMHESGCLRYVREIASGKAYEGRADLGNNVEGDGVKFKGRGLLQITGKANYKIVSQALFGDTRLLINPDLLEVPEYAVASACWFWGAYKQLNDEADRGEFEIITRRINGGLNGYAERVKLYNKAKEIYCC